MDKNNTPKPSEDSASGTPQQAPSDALSRTPEELAEQMAEQAADLNALDAPEEKKLSPIKRFFKKVNVYLLSFVLLFIVVGAVTIVNFLNSTQEEQAAELASQELTQETLQQLANTDASVGNESQTLTIQGNAVIAGQSLMRGNVNIAGNLQTGGTIQGPSLTISGSTSLGDTQANTLQVASNAAVQGTTTLRDLAVSGASTFSGPISASQITVTRLIMSGNASLEIPNHISFTGASPSRNIDTGVLGSGGSASIDGSDTAGTVNISTGNGPKSGCFVRITFQQAYTRQPHVIISPVGNAAGRLEYYVDRSTTSFSICTANTPTANQTFAFDYFVTY